MLREPEARDRAAIIELFASPEVGTYIGGPRPRDELERAVPEVPRRRPGLFVVALDGAMIGIVTLDRRDAERKGHIRSRSRMIHTFDLRLPREGSFRSSSSEFGNSLDLLCIFRFRPPARSLGPATRRTT